MQIGMLTNNGHEEIKGAYRGELESGLIVAAGFRVEFLDSASVMRMDTSHALSISPRVKDRCLPGGWIGSARETKPTTFT